jgi:hypothetical protein
MTDSTVETACNIAHFFDQENWSDEDFNTWTFGGVESNTGNNNAKPSFVCDGYRMAGGYSYMGSGSNA